MKNKIKYTIIGVIIFFLAVFIFQIIDINKGSDKKLFSNQINDDVSFSSSTENIDIQTMENNIIKLAGENYKLYNTEEINNGKAYYFAPGDYPDTSSQEIIINAYDKNIKAKALADSIIAEQEKYGNKIYKPFSSPDKNKKDAYYITSLAIYYPDEPYADIYIMKVFNAGRTYMIIYREALPGVGEAGLELIADTWLTDNLENYGMEIEKIDPQSILANQEIQVGNDGIFIEDNQSNNPDLKTVSADDVDISTIAEETFSDEELKAYYASYKNPYVIHLRKVLDVYLVDRYFGMDMPEVVDEKRVDGDTVHGLSAFDRSYYKSKFIVWQIDDHIGGGKDITLIFQDKPDRIFHAWVYQLGNEGKDYDLRDFWENTETSKGVKILLKAYGKYILDKNHSI